jgi:predicted Ser/Thr protein kinase
VSTAEAEQGAGVSARGFLEKIAARTLERFETNRRLLSFSQYLEMVQENPACHTRDAARYLRDCFDHFGVQELDTPVGKQRRWSLFDCPFDEGQDRLVGQEHAQQEFYRVLTRFVKNGRIQRLALLHGPNGSAKSSFIGCVMRAMEAYSHTDQGALYRFNWVFPTEKIARGAIGFGEGGGGVAPTDTYAFLDDLDVDAKLVCELKDNPLLLLPVEERVPFLRGALEAAGASLKLADVIERGQLSHKSRKIFEALLTAYQGDLSAVLRHVQVERFYFSHRYRLGAVTIEPQLRVDAGLRQISVDRSLQSLPTSLQNQTLFEPFGDLVDANRGVVEYNDLFKRPQEYNRYLLSTCEKGTVSLEHAILHLDLLMVGSANETYLEAFKQSPDYPSYKARFDLIRMPYLRSYVTEQQIYEEQISGTELGKPLAPHATYVAALWAVLTRLQRPDPDKYPSVTRDMVRKLTPLQKARLYALGEVPEGLTGEQAKELRAVVERMWHESDGRLKYEGRYGVSPREMKSIILNAAQNANYPHLSPLAIFEALRELVSDPTVYRFLQMEPDGPYARHADFIDLVQEHYLDIIDKEVRVAMGLVDEEQYTRFFERYIEHATHWVKGEQLYNKVVGAYEDPDEELMVEVEEKIGVGGEEAQKVRNDIMAGIAAWSIDHPGEPLNYIQIFPLRFEALKQSFYDERVEQLRRIKNNLMAYLTSDENPLNVAESDQVETTLNSLCAQFGHTLESAREAILFLLRHRYDDERSS